MAVDPDRCDYSWSLRCLDMDQGPDRAEVEEKGKGKVLACDDVNIADLLPVDPFGMDMKSTVTAIKGWLQDIDEDFAFNFDEFWIDELENDGDDDGSFAGTDWFFNGALRLQPQKGVFSFDGISIPEDGFNVGPWWDFGELGCSRSVGSQAGLGKGKELQDEGGVDPHEAFYLALGYLEVEDLVSVEGVCSSLRDAVRGDPLLWRSLKLKQPLSMKVTDDVLVKLTSRAQGSLECLSLVDCIKISDSGLKQVLDSNPRLEKLSVPGCVRLTIEGILKNLRVLKAAGTLRVKHLRIGGLGCVSESNFEELKSLLGAGENIQLRPNKPQYYHLGPVYLSCDDDRPIDVEPCPICQRVGLIYDCPAENCRGKDQVDQKCRACTPCISRCIQCGCCITDLDYEETFLFDLICPDCFKQILSLEKQKAKSSSSGHTIFRHEMRYQFCFYGD